MNDDVAAKMRQKVLDSVKIFESDIVKLWIPDSLIRYQISAIHGMLEMCAISNVISLDENIEIRHSIDNAIQEFRPSL